MSNFAYGIQPYLKQWQKISVQDTKDNVIKVDGEDYICLMDMLRAKDGDFS